MTESPCDSCPFRRNTSKGHSIDWRRRLDVGTHEAEINYSCKRRDDKTCIGADIYMANTLKLPRAKFHSDRVANTEQNKLIVYATRAQMRGEKHDKND